MLINIPFLYCYICFRITLTHILFHIVWYTKFLRCFLHQPLNLLTTQFCQVTVRIYCLIVLCVTLILLQWCPYFPSYKTEIWQNFLWKYFSLQCSPMPLNGLFVFPSHMSSTRVKISSEHCVVILAGKRRVTLTTFVLNRIYPFKTTSDLNCVKSFSSYRTGNTLHFGYKNHLILYREIIAVFPENQ
jgi:hypothetical protein